VSSDYWSSTTGAGAYGTNDAWKIDFDDGYDYWHSKDYSDYVRAVRGGQPVSSDHSIIPLSPDPNPSTSTVMAGGTVYRYYKTVDDNNAPASGVAVTVTCGGRSYHFTSDASGIVAISLEADHLGNPGDTVTCRVTEPGVPFGFQVEIQKRESDANYKLGSGINVAAAIGIGAKMGDSRGLVYTVIDSDVNTKQDEQIGVTRAHDSKLGPWATVGIGAGMKGVGYAQASAEVSALSVFSTTNSYLFSEPYTSDQETLRSGLVLASLFQSAGSAVPLANRLIDFVVETFESRRYEEYKTGEEFAMGARVEGSAGAGAGLGIVDKENVKLGVGFGAGIDASAQLLAHTISRYTYASSTLNLDEKGYGASLGAELDLFAGVEIGGSGDIVGSWVKAGLEGGWAGQFKIIFYTDPSGDITRGEFIFSGPKDWGVKVGGLVSSGTDSTSSFTLIVDRDQLAVLADDISNIANLSTYISSDVPRDLDLGPTRLKKDFVKLFNALSAMRISYRVEEEKGTVNSINPEVSLALGSKLELGLSIDVEKSVSMLKEQGIMSAAYGKFPQVLYGEDSHVPKVADLAFGPVVQDCGVGLSDAATLAGWIVRDVAGKVKDETIGAAKWLWDKRPNLFHKGGTPSVFQARAALYRSFPAVPAQMRSASMASTQEGKFGIGGVFSFTPEDMTIPQLSGKITSPQTLSYENASIVLQPGVATAQITITYTDADAASVNEADLRLFRWDDKNKLWVQASNIWVDAGGNRVTGAISRLGTFTLGIPLPQGVIALGMSPQDVDPNALTDITVTSGTIKFSTGEVVPDGTLATVAIYKKFDSQAAAFGTITTPDEDSSIAGVQVATRGGVITFEFTPPSEEGSGVAMASTVEGAAQGEATFNMVQNLDSDANGLPDYWEIQYFGAINQGAMGDPDGDGLINYYEYQNGTNPTKKDTDGDGMPEGWELDNGLNPLLDDANRDADGDLFSNLEEYLAGTDPRNDHDCPKPVVTRDPATLITGNSARLNVTVNPGGAYATTTVVFQWGTTLSYGNKITAAQSPLTGTTPQTVSADLTGLAPGTTYYYRIDVANSFWMVSKMSISFTTTADATASYVNKGDGACGGKSPCYTSIQEAVNGADNGAKIKIVRGTYDESITLNTSKSVTLQGGWDASFSTQTSNTTFIKAPKALKGSITLKMVTIKP